MRENKQLNVEVEVFFCVIWNRFQEKINYIHKKLKTTHYLNDVKLTLLDSV
jgi:hypothetical protein